MTIAKQKGNIFEHKIAKKLGSWMFNDELMLNRHPTSGAEKSVYVGDIVPYKRIPNNWNDGIWPFYIECKNGYKNQIPNLINQNIIYKWISKIVPIDNKSNQKIIFLIAGFHGYSPILLTNKKIKFKANLLLNYDKDNFFFIYNFNDLLLTNFESLYGSMIKMD